MVSSNLSISSSSLYSSQAISDVIVGKGISNIPHVEDVQSEQLLLDPMELNARPIEELQVDHLQELYGQLENAIKEFNAVDVPKEFETWLDEQIAEQHFSTLEGSESELHTTEMFEKVLSNSLGIIESPIGKGVGITTGALKSLASTDEKFENLKEDAEKLELLEMAVSLPLEAFSLYQLIATGFVIRRARKELVKMEADLKSSSGPEHAKLEKEVAKLKEWIDTHKSELYNNAAMEIAKQAKSIPGNIKTILAVSGHLSPLVGTVLSGTGAGVGLLLSIYSLHKAYKSAASSKAWGKELGKASLDLSGLDATEAKAKVEAHLEKLAKQDDNYVALKVSTRNALKVFAQNKQRINHSFSIFAKLKAYFSVGVGLFGLFLFIGKVLLIVTGITAIASGWGLVGLGVFGIAAGIVYMLKFHPNYVKTVFTGAYFKYTINRLQHSWRTWRLESQKFATQEKRILLENHIACLSSQYTTMQEDVKQHLEDMDTETLSSYPPEWKSALEDDIHLFQGNLSKKKELLASLEEARKGLKEIEEQEVHEASASDKLSENEEKQLKPIKDKIRKAEAKDMMAQYWRMSSPTGKAPAGANYESLFDDLPKHLTQLLSNSGPVDPEIAELLTKHLGIDLSSLPKDKPAELEKTLKDAMLTFFGMSATKTSKFLGEKDAQTAK